VRLIIYFVGSVVVFHRANYIKGYTLVLTTFRNNRPPLKNSGSIAEFWMINCFFILFLLLIRIVWPLLQPYKNDIKPFYRYLEKEMN